MSSQRGSTVEMIYKNSQTVDGILSILTVCLYTVLILHVYIEHDVLCL